MCVAHPPRARPWYDHRVNQPKKKGGLGATAIIIVASLCVLFMLCGGIGAAIGIPAFTGYLARAKTAEASSNLRNLHTMAAGYYSNESFSGATVTAGGGAQTACAVESAITPTAPGPNKYILDPSSLPESFTALGWSPADPLYYQYEIVSVGGCGHSAGENLYSFRAYGDLDGDGVTSLYELTAGVDASGALYRSPGIYTEQELE